MRSEIFSQSVGNSTTRGWSPPTPRVVKVPCWPDSVCWFLPNSYSSPMTPVSRERRAKSFCRPQPLDIHGHVSRQGREEEGVLHGAFVAVEHARDGEAVAGDLVGKAAQRRHSVRRRPGR